MVQFLKTNFSVFDMFGIFLPAVVFCFLLVVINYSPVINESFTSHPQHSKNITQECAYAFQSSLKSFQNIKSQKYYLPRCFFCNKESWFVNNLEYSQDKNIIKAKPIFPIYDLLQKISNIFKNETQKFIFCIFSLCVVIYFVGHLLMAFGSTFIDRFIVAKWLGYPYEELFSEIKFKKNSKWHDFRKIFYSTLFLNVFLILLIFMYTDNLIVLGFAFVWFLCMIVLRTIFSTKRSKLNRKCKEIKNEKERNEIEDKLNQDLIWFKRAFYILSVFTSLLYILIYKWLKNLHSHHSFPNSFQDNFQKIFHKDYSVEMNDARENIFSLIFTCLHDNLPSACAQLLYARRLVYLFRNLTISFLLAFLICVVVQLTQSKINLAVYASCFLGFSVISFIRFYYIYFNSFSKNIFRAYYEYKCRVEVNKKNSIIQAIPDASMQGVTSAPCLNGRTENLVQMSPNGTGELQTPELIKVEEKGSAKPTKN